MESFKPIPIEVSTICRAVLQHEIDVSRGSVDANGRRIRHGSTGIAARPDAFLATSPDLDFQFQLDTVDFGHLCPDQIDQLQNVVGRGPVMRDDKVGVTVAHLALTNPRPFQSGLLNECTGAEATRILEDAPGRLEGEPAEPPSS